MCPAALGCALLWPSLLASRPLHSLELALSLQLADQRCRGPGVVRISKHRPTRLPNQPNQPPQLAASPQTMPSIGPSAPLAVTAFTQAHLDRVLAAADESGGACAPQAATAKLLSLFQLAQSTVPAYKDFVRQQRQQQAAEVQGEGEGAEGGGGGAAPHAGAAPPASLEAVPFTSKESYVRAFPLPARCQGGSLGAADFVHCSSGSSGAPTYWVRNAWDELEVAARFEQVGPVSPACRSFFPSETCPAALSRAGECSRPLGCALAPRPNWE